MGFLAHPVPGHTHLIVSPAPAVLGTVVFLLAVAVLWPPKGSRSWGGGDDLGGRLHSWAGGVTPLQVATRSLALAVLILAAAAGRAGSPDELRNIAPALVIGVGWPMLIAGSALLGPVWRWGDPWDSVTRAVERAAGPASSSTTPAPSVWPVVVPTLLWVWYLAAYADALEPRSVGAALAIYSIVTVAGSVIVGRARWFSSFEVFGLLFGWAARLPRRLLPSWTPPVAADVVLGILGGGLLFGLVRRSSLWENLNLSPRSDLYAVLGLLAFAAGGVAVVVAGERFARFSPLPGAVTAACVPLVVGLALALALANNRLLTSLQLLPRLASDPFGLGWDLFGTADWILSPNPLGGGGRAVLQIAILALSGGAGVAVAATRGNYRARLAATAVMTGLVGAAVVAVAVG